MYIPKHFEVNDLEKQLEIINQFPLGALIYVEKGIFGAPTYTITHMPFIVRHDEYTGKKYLVGHLAKENEQVPILKATKYQCLVAFKSTDSYVSPSWYPTKHENHKSVPTWDFAAVNVYGVPKIIEDKEWLMTLLNNLTDQEEDKRPEGEEYQSKWKLSHAPDSYIDIMLKNIVGIEIEIEKTEAKFKFNQNRKPVDANGLIDNYKKEVGGTKGDYMATKTKEHYPKAL